MPFLANNPPEVEWSGYLSHGYVMRDDPTVREVLESAHNAVTGRPLDRRLATSLNDARFYDRHFGMPAFCYGPIGERIHGFNERLNLASLRETTKTIANFVALWCGIEPAANRSTDEAAHWENGQGVCERWTSFGPQGVRRDDEASKVERYGWRDES